MRLLDTRDGSVHWVEDPRQYNYAILSHVWATPSDSGPSELTYEDLCKLQEASKLPRGRPVMEELPDKIRRFCDMAREDGFDFGWADSCCIDKTSSSELSEAINSMFNWYGYSGACYAFLPDVSAPPTSPAPGSGWEERCRGSKWFKRGWTLQELLAPRVVVFVCCDKAGKWVKIGSKHSLAALISSVTGIEMEVLTLDQPLEEIPVARRMSWAHSRETTRIEDEAYCLMGIFSVSMQTNYGEGRFAFIRLQQEILWKNPDQSIFAWGRRLISGESILRFASPSTTSTSPSSASSAARHITVTPDSFLKQYLLASSPKDFDPHYSATITTLSRSSFEAKLGSSSGLYQEFQITQFGIRAQFPLLSVSTADAHQDAPTHLAILACEDPDKGLLCLLLRPRAPPSVEFFAGAVVKPTKEYVSSDDTYSLLADHYYRITHISPERLRSFRGSGNLSLITSTRVMPKMSSIYIAPSASRPAIELDRDADIHYVLWEIKDDFDVEFCRWSKAVLDNEGYTTSLDQESTSSSPIILRTPYVGKVSPITITNAAQDLRVTIRIGRCNCELGQSRGVLAALVSSSDAPDPAGMGAHGPHTLNHDMHIHSWSVQHGAASKLIQLVWRRNYETAVLRLTLTTLAPRSGAAPARRTFRLGAEIRLTPTVGKSVTIDPKLSSSSLAAAPPPQTPPSAVGASQLAHGPLTLSTGMYILLCCVAVFSLLTNFTLGLLLVIWRAPH